MRGNLLRVFLGIALLSGTPALPDDITIKPLQQLAPADEIHIWLTHYNKHFAPASVAADSVPLRDKNGKSLGLSVSPRDFCYGAMEGTLVVRSGPTSNVYNADGLAGVSLVDCSKFYPHSNVRIRLGRQAFVKLGANAPDGRGVLTYRLVPDRTIAVSNTTIPYGTVLFIPQLKKDGVATVSGARAHDGYVFAADTGGSMNGCHVDYFTGGRAIDPDATMTSSKAHPRAIVAYVVHDPEIRNKLIALHNLSLTTPVIRPIARSACKATTIPPYPPGES